jgi:lipopolysaccharide export system permease protein
MLRIQRAFLGELLVVFGLITAVTTGVVFAGFTVYLLADTEGLATHVFIELLPHLVPTALSYAIPFSFVAAMCLVVGRMQSENEITSLRSAGLHLRVLVVPAAAVAGLLALGGMAFDAQIVPQAQRQVRSGLKRYLETFLSSLKGNERSVVLGAGRLSYARYDAEAHEFVDVEIDRRDDEGKLEQKIIARRVRIRPIPGKDGSQDQIEFLFHEADLLQAGDPTGMTVSYQGPESRIQLGRVESAGASGRFNELFGMQRYLSKPKEMTARELLYAVERGQVDRAPPATAREWLHRNLALGASPLSLGLLAMAIALVLPASGRRVRDFVVSFLPTVLLYFPIVLIGGSLVRSGFPAWLGMWSGNLLLLVLSGALFALAFRR